MIRRPRSWRIRGFLLTGTIRRLGSRTCLSLTLTDTETGYLIWSARQRPPFDGLVEAFDGLVARIAECDQAEINSQKTGRPEGLTAQRERSERTREARERARLAHNLVMERTLNRGLRNAP